MAKRLAAYKDRAGENLGAAWGELAEYVAYELNKEGLEGAVLAHLAPYPKSAFDVAWNEFGSEDSHLQCIGAVFPLESPSPGRRVNTSCRRRFGGYQPVSAVQAPSQAQETM